VPRILVVDDTQFNILAVKTMIFEHFKIGVDQAINGLIAVEMYLEGYQRKCRCPNRTYKLIIMDLQMPVMGGIEAS
jgi:CheY-like chemotaxis protein